MQDQLFKRVMGARIAFSVLNILLLSWQLYNHKRSKRNDKSIKTKVSLRAASFVLCLCSAILLEVGVGSFHRYGSDLESLVYDELQAIQGLAWTMLALHIIALLAGCLIIHNGRSRHHSDTLPCYYEVIEEDETSVDVKEGLAVTLPDDISDGSIEYERRFEDCSASI